MNRLRDLLWRNRGLLAALGAVLVALPATLGLGQPRPLASSSYTEMARSSGPTHDRGIKAMFSPDGRGLLIYGADQGKVRDLATGEIGRLATGEFKFGEDYRWWLYRPRFLDGGRLLVGLLVGGDPEKLIHPTLVIWDFPAGRERATVREVGDGSHGWKFGTSDDGSTLAYLIGPPGPPTVVVWRSSEDWRPRSFAGKGPIALSADGRFLAVVEPGDPSEMVAVWEVASSRRLGTIRDRPEVFALSPDGKTLAGNGKNGPTLWDVATATRRVDLASSSTGLPWPWFSPDGSRLVLRDRSIEEGHAQVEFAEVWDLAVGPPRPVFQGYIRGISRDCRLIVQEGPNLAAPPGSPGSAAAPDSGMLVEIPSMRPRGPAFGPGLRSVAFSSDGRKVLLHRINMVQSSFGPWLRWLPASISSLAPEMTLENRLQVIETDWGRTLASVDLSRQTVALPGRTAEEFESALVLAPDGTTLAIHFLQSAETGDDRDISTVELWDIRAGFPRWPILAGLAAAALALGRWSDVRSRRRALAASMPA